MKRIVFVLFLIGFAVLTARADTIGYYRVSLNGKEVASATEFHKIRINLDSDSIAVTDTLEVLWFSCGSRIAGRYRVMVRDSLTDAIVYSDTTSGTYYSLPLDALMEWKTDNRGAVFKGSFISVNSRSQHQILFEIKLE